MMRSARFEHFTWVVVTCLVLLLGIAAYLWLFTVRASEFGLNFFTEIMGVGITVLVVDRLIGLRERRREEAKELPRRLAAYRHIARFTTRFVHDYVWLYQMCSKDPLPNTIEEFFQPRTFKMLNLRLNFSAPIGQDQPGVLLRDYLFSSAERGMRNGERILDRSSGLSPDVQNHFDQLLYSDFFDFLLGTPARDQLFSQMQKEIEASGQYFDQSHRTFLFAPTDVECKAMVGLYHWCHAEYILLKDHGAIRPIVLYASKGQGQPKAEFLKPEFRDRPLNAS